MTGAESALLLPSQTQGTATHWLVANYTLLGDRGTCHVCEQPA